MDFIIAALFIGSFLYFYIQYINKKNQEEKEKQEHNNHKVHFKVLMDDGTIENHTMSWRKAQDKFPIIMPGGFRKAFSKEPFGVPDDIKNVISLMDRGESIRKIRKKIKKGEIGWLGPK